MFGGKYVVISGPCVELGAKRVLFFGSPKKCERKSDFSFVCITPIFNKTGDVLFLIYTDNKGVNSTFQGLYIFCKYTASTASTRLRSLYITFYLCCKCATFLCARTPPNAMKRSIEICLL